MRAQEASFLGHEHVMQGSGRSPQLEGLTKFGLLAL